MLGISLSQKKEKNGLVRLSLLMWKEQKTWKVSEASRGEAEDSSSWKRAIIVSERVQGFSIKVKESCSSTCPSSES